ncbi:MAG: flagellar protein FlaG [Firmicutes bacterium]|nr:flagellar protein FlaG [Bacillota bacterium]
MDVRDVRPLQGAQGPLPPGRSDEAPPAAGRARSQSGTGEAVPRPAAAMPAAAADIAGAGVGVAPVAGADQSGMDMLQRVTEAVNSVISIVNTRVTFEVHKETGHVVIKVIDIDTGEVLREIPPKELLGVMTKLAKLVLAGLLVDEKL